MKRKNKALIFSLIQIFLQIDAIAFLFFDGYLIARTSNSFPWDGDYLKYSSWSFTDFYSESITERPIVNVIVIALMIICIGYYLIKMLFELNERSNILTRKISVVFSSIPVITTIVTLITSYSASNYDNNFYYKSVLRITTTSSGIFMHLEIAVLACILILEILKIFIPTKE